MDWLKRASLDISTCQLQAISISACVIHPNIHPSCGPKGSSNRNLNMELSSATISSVINSQDRQPPPGHSTLAGWKMAGSNRIMDDWFKNTIASFEDEIQDMGCIEDPSTATAIVTLKNEIHPMFHISRWMKGYGQQTEQFYGNMRPALLLASLWLTEDCVLPWWTHAHFGRPVEGQASDGTGANIVYIESSEREHSREARQATRTLLMVLAEVIVLMFRPTISSDCFAITCNRRGLWKWSDNFQEKRLPPSTKGLSSWAKEAESGS